MKKQHIGYTNITGILLCLLLLSGCKSVAAIQALAATSKASSSNLVEAETPLPAATPTPDPTFTPSPTIEVCRETEGRIVHIEIPSELVPKTLPVSIYTPPCFTEASETPYPVLYLLHGQGMDDTYWLELGVALIADEAILNGQAPFLMVMPFEEKNYDPTGESKFGEAVMEELLPWVEANYPVCVERECRAIGGISRGGGWAVHLALRNFDTFGAVGAHSMSLMPTDRWYVGQLLVMHTVAEFPRFYVDRGEQDFLAGDIDLFESALTQGKIPHEFVISPLGHEGAYWQAHVAEYMRWYMQGWQ